MIIIGVAFLAAIIDTSLGMCYGTVLTPFLIIYGYSPIVVVPVVLLSQLVVDIAGGATHFKVKNFTRKDMQVAMLVAVPATLLAGIGAFANLSFPKVYTKTYIGILVTLMGIMLLYGFRLRQSKRGLTLISGVAGFNKGFMGGGFGPVVVSGQMIYNHDVRPSIAIGDIAEIPVCIVGLTVFVIFSQLTFETIFVLVCIPAVIGALIGPHITVYIGKTGHPERFIGSIMFVLGMITLYKVFGV